MLFISALNKNLIKSSFILLAPLFVFFSQISETQAKIVVEKNSNFGVIKGVIRDESGKPISNAVVAFFKPGIDEIYKLAKSNSNGNYLTRIIPGTYMIIAAAKGFSTVTIPQVQVNRSIELNYGFNLVRVGSGNTLPEKTIDRNNSKWRIRAAQSSRSIYQNGEGDIPVGEDARAENEFIEDERADPAKRRAQSVIETYFAGSSEGNYTGFNFATLQPLGENSEIIFAGQTGTKSFAPNRFETTFQTRPNENHQIRLSTSLTKIGKVKTENIEKELGQVSFQAFDEWKVREGIIVVLGVDYSRFFGAGDDSSIAPRLGLQYDINAKTRLKTAYTTQTEEKTWAEALEFEGSQVLFRQQFEPKSISLEESKPQMNKSRRLEFGVERILSNNSSIEATAFFDSVSGRGIGLTNLPINALNAESFNQIDATQQGRAEGIRVVYSRRLNGTFSTSAGYAFGSGQKLSPQAITNPNNVFENGLFQTFVGQLNTDLKTGTSVQTIFRLSPQATIFAIDPFQGRLAIYDPSLSILVTQPLPTWGLPIQATAVIDARNLLDFQTSASNEEGSLLFSSPRRVLRGGISVRF
jgi:Carboxypeptidase regulatory-like domain